MKHFLSWIFVPACIFAQTPSVLNMSHDLVANGIAAQNLQPNVPTLDVRPLFEQAVAYAAKNNIAAVTADYGSYYFLSLHSVAANAEHVLLNAAANMTIDWQNSDLYFAFSNRAAIQCANCSNVTMQNFTVDYTQLPFTQVTVTSVDPTKGILGYQAIAGYQSPVDLNADRAVDHSDANYVFVFRNGAPLAIGRLTGIRPSAASSITVMTDTPWSKPAYLSLIQPGDTLVIEDRSGPPALNFVGGDHITVRGVSVYSSGQIGLYFGRTNTATADRVQIIPRPGTTRLISVNADGIHTSFALGPQTFTNNIVRRTCDDAYAISAPWIGAVTKDSTGTTVAVTRAFSSPFPLGTSISFVSDADTSIVGTATIVAEAPPVAQQTFTDGETVTLTLSQAVPVSAGFGMIDADPNKRGSGSVISNNLFVEGVFARGIWLAGVQSVNVHDNFVEKTSNIGIFVQQLSADLFTGGPSSDITIQNNVVDNTLNYGGVSAGPVISAASIHVVSEDNKNGQATKSPNTNIKIVGNRVTNSPRSAIRMENVNGGAVTGNVIQAFAQSPTTNIYNLPPCCETMTQYLADFNQPVLQTNSTGVVTTPNTITNDASNLIASASSASYSPKVAVDSLAFSYAPLPLPPTLNGVTVNVTDNTGTTRPAPIVAISPTVVSYQVPHGTALGVATVTIAAFSGGILVDSVAPSLYSENSSGQGVAAANGLLVAVDGSSSLQNVFSPTCTPGSCTALPLNLGGADDKLYIILYGTGLRNASSVQNATATIGGVPASIAYLGPQPSYPGFDQANILVPRSLAGAGEVPIVLTVDGQTANAVTISVK